MTQIEGNKLIAEFMSYVYKPVESLNRFKGVLEKEGKLPMVADEMHHLYSPQYHASWDWLMPVVEKISNIEFDRDEQELPFGGTETIIHTHYPRTFGMLNNETRRPMFRFNCSQLFEADTLIEATWLAVVDFIQFYNQQRELKV